MESSSNGRWQAKNKLFNTSRQSWRKYPPPGGVLHRFVDSTDPVKLTQYCWFYVTLHFALRGAEVQIKLKKTDLVFCSSDGTGEYTTLATDFMSKNCPGGVKGREFNTCGKITDKRQVAAVRKLVSKSSPLVDRFFQRAKPGHRKSNEEAWYLKVPLGHVVLQDMLPRISTAAKLTQRYTNHSVRATSIVLLKEAGYDDREVCEITGHKNPSSLGSYVKPNNNDCNAMAAVLDGESKAKATGSTTTIASALTTAAPLSRPMELEKLPTDSSLADTLQKVTFNMKGSVFNNLTINFGGRPNVDNDSKAVFQHHSSCR